MIAAVLAIVLAMTPANTESKSPQLPAWWRRE